MASCYACTIAAPLQEVQFCGLLGKSEAVSPMPGQGVFSESVCSLAVIM